MKLIRILLIITILTFSYETFAQLNRVGMPYMRELQVAGHGGAKQSFDIAIDKYGKVFLANTSSGVFVFDGSNWTAIRPESQSTVLSICINEDTDSIYVGAYNDLGVLRNTQNNAYEFCSLVDTLPEHNQNFGKISNILYTRREGVVFQSPDYIFTLKDDSISVISGRKAEVGFSDIFKCGDRIFPIHPILGIRELKDGKLVELPGIEDAGVHIKYMCYSDGKIVMVNQDHGMVEYQDGKCKIVECEFSEFLKANAQHIDKALRTHDGNYVFAIRSVGLVVTDKNYNVIKTIKGKSKVHRLLEDRYNLLWVCEDADVKVIDLYSPYSYFPNSATGIIGSVKSMLRKDDNLYIGADAVYQSGLSNLSTESFRELKNDKGYTGIWSISNINNQIIGGSNRGLFLIDSLNNFINIDNINVSRNIFKVKSPEDRPDLIIGVGGTNGLSSYQRVGNTWQYRVGVDGGPDRFETQSRNIEIDEDGYYWVSHYSQGLYRLKFNSTYDTLVSAREFTMEDGLPSKTNNYIFRADKGICIATPDGIYRYSKEADSIVEDTRLNKVFGGKKAFDMIYYNEGNLWVKHIITTRKGGSETKSWYLEQYVLTSDSTADCIYNQFLPFKSNIVSFGYIGDGKYVIGSGDRFTTYDQSISKDFSASYKALIHKIENLYTDTLIYGGNLVDGKRPKIVLPYEEHNIRITYAAAYYERPEDTKFNTYLENNDDSWTGFRSENYKEYPNLRPGTYTMHVIAQNCYGVESEEATITFQILPPWYLTKLAIVIYAILFGLLMWLIIIMYTKKLIRDKQNLEKIVEERTTEIRQQSQLIMAQNKSITDSINYAKHIQRAMLPLDEKIAGALPNHFILFRPKDIVSGDYYWFAETDKYIIITAADCTGHGVPGAFMSMIGSQILTEIVGEGITSPDLILTNQNRRIRKALKQDTTENHDGMDMALCTINKETHLVEFAGAKNQLVVIKNGELTEYKADKQGIGGSQLYGDDFQYKKTSIEPDGNTWFYMFSDGYKDQFGGPDNSKFLIKRLRQLLLDIHDKSPEEQRKILNDTIQEWIDAGKGEQTDDIILMGFKL